MPVKENIALFDLDGTLVDYDLALRERMKLIQHPSETPYVIRSLDEKEEPYQKARRKMIQSLPGFWSDMKKFQLGYDILEVAKELGFNINILTKGPKDNPTAWMEKFIWCEKELSPILGQIGEDFFVGVVQDKGLTYGKILVDDYPPYILRWLKWRPRGLVIMPAHEWNKDFEHPNMMRYEGDEHQLEEIRDAMEMARERI
jgi:hypothetical protein